MPSPISTHAQLHDARNPGRSHEEAPTHSRDKQGHA
ncbi:ubiquitin [Arthrobacter woluwensis]|nr:ubiquitin [Arthrobacter woluwensis]